MSIEVRNINKTFQNGFKALVDVDLKIQTGELVALLGPSGSGKTTLLRIIAGLEQADAGGQILLWDEDVAEHHVSARNVGFVFQHYALFRHMTVFENVAFGLRRAAVAAAAEPGEIKDRVLELLRLVQLDGFAKRFPNQLSGGQRQRVALARALAVEPKVLLLDEPFGALDAKVRRELRRWLRKLHDEVHITSVFVTHDQEEALEVSDRIAVMSKGRIEQVGSPEEVYDKPANPFVYNFLGNVNLFHARTEADQIGEAIASARASAKGGGAGVAYVRPHDVEITREAGGPDKIAVRVDHIGFAGSVVNVQLQRVDSKELVEAEINREAYKELGLKLGDEVFVRVRNATVFEAHDYSI